LKPGIYFLAVVFIVPALAKLNKNAEFVKNIQLKTGPKTLQIIGETMILFAC